MEPANRYLGRAPEIRDVLLNPPEAPRSVDQLLDEAERLAEAMRAVKRKSAADCACPPDPILPETKLPTPLAASGQRTAVYGPVSRHAPVASHLDLRTGESTFTNHVRPGAQAGQKVDDRLVRIGLDGVTDKGVRRSELVLVTAEVMTDGVRRVTVKRRPHF